MPRSRKNGVYDYIEYAVVNGHKYKYFVKVIQILGLDGTTHKRVRARTIEQLQAKVTEFLADSVDGHATDVTVGQWCDRWVSKVLPATVKKSTLSYYRYMLGYLSDSVRKKKLTTLTPVDLQEMFTDLLSHGAKREANTLSSTTVRGVRSTLISALDCAIDNQLLSVNVAKKSRPLAQTDKREITFLTAEQIQSLLQVSDSFGYCKDIEQAMADPGRRLMLQQWSVVIRLALATGLRRGELFGLAWDCVDTDARTISVRRNLQARRLETPKTRNSVRVVTIDKDTASRLQSWKESQEQYAVTVGDLFNNNHNLLFTNSSGGFVSFENFRNRVFDPMIKAAGLPDTVTLHSLRHTHATQLLAAGVDAKTVSKRLGHSSVAFTLQTYTHVLNEMENTAADAIAKVLAGKKDSGD